MRRVLVLVSVLVALLSAASTASAAPGVVQNLPGCATNTLAANDDESTDAVPLGFTAQMFDTQFSSVFVNNNGNITIADPLSEFTPFDFRETGQPMIAPFFADVDTTGANSGLMTYGPVQGGVGGKPAFCVIWNNVGYFSSHDDKLNRFQLIIVQQTGGIDVIFNYDSMTWETGDASGGAGGLGGTSAVAGYAAGDGDAAHALMLPGSFVNGGLLDSNGGSSLAGHNTAGQPAGRYLFQLRQGAATGGRLTGTITTPSAAPAGGALVQICISGGGCVTRVASSDGVYAASNLAAGNYTVTAFPGPGPAFASTHVDNVAVGGPGTTKTQNLQLGELPPPPPAGTTITNIGTSPDDIPIAYWNDPLDLVTTGCTGAVATYQMVLEGRLVRNGPLTESPAGSGTYRATIAALIPHSGDGQITVHFDCPGATPDQDVDFGIYIDPSGVVRDTAGQPVAGALVTLTRSASASGPFFAVPDGSAVMSPANRSNPDITRSDGRFGWDVVAGFYVVTASKPGCVSAADPTKSAATTSVLTIPPPVTNLDIRLDCSPRPTSNPTPAPSGGGTPPVVISQQPPALPKLASIRKVVLKKGRVLVTIACAKAAKKACAGAVTVKLGRKVVARKSYKGIKRGKSATIKLTLSKAGRAAIAKVKRGKKIKLVVSATVKDAAKKGATATRTVSVRR